MKRNVFVALLALLSSATCMAQNDSTIFRGYFYNNEYNVYLNIDLYDEDIAVPNHDILGDLPGYLGKKNNNFYWLIVSKEFKTEKQAEINLINDYGSEDLTATFTMKNDSTFVLKQGEGSTLKVPNKGKWQKLPSSLEFKKR